MADAGRLRIMCDPDAELSPGEHKHRCSCGACWKHCSDDFDTSAEFDLAHACPDCGKDVRRKFFAEGDDEMVDFVLVDDGPSDADIRLAEELGRHAAKEAMDAAMRVLKTVPNDVYPAAVAVAHADLRFLLKAVEAQMDAIKPDFSSTVAKLERHRAKVFGARIREASEAFRRKHGGKP